MDGRAFLLPRSSVSKERTFQEEAKMIKLNVPTGIARASPKSAATISTMTMAEAAEVVEVNTVDYIDGAKKKLAA